MDLREEKSWWGK